MEATGKNPMKKIYPQLSANKLVMRRVGIKKLYTLISQSYQQLIY